MSFSNFSKTFTTYRVTLQDGSVLETKIPCEKTFQSAILHLNPKQKVIQVQWLDPDLGDGIESKGWLNVLPGAVQKFEKKRLHLTSTPSARSNSKNA
jgi:hypothetical protein